MTYVFTLLFWLFGTPAQAGAPPPDLIPWDTVWVVDTVETARGPVTVRTPVEFITRDKYERDVLGWESVPNLREAQRDLAIIKELIKAAKKP